MCIFHVCREPPPKQIQTIFGTLCHLIDLINFAKFNLDLSRVLDRRTYEKRMIPLKAKSCLTMFSAAALTSDTGSTVYLR